MIVLAFGLVTALNSKLRDIIYIYNELFCSLEWMCANFMGSFLFRISTRISILRAVDMHI